MTSNTSSNLLRSQIGQLVRDRLVSDRRAERPMQALLTCFPREGRVCWIGLRPERRVPLIAVDHAVAQAGIGLDGDHYRGSRNGKRQVTLIQAEHLAVVGALIGEAAIEPGRLRRNLVIEGINLLALKDRRFRVGGALLQGTGLAHPCSRMEEELGAGGYNAMRGHGGLTAQVIEGGPICVGDAVCFIGDVEP
jgi:MOSC domain-containing protein YiiM